MGAMLSALNISIHTLTLSKQARLLGSTITINQRSREAAMRIIKTVILISLFALSSGANAATLILDGEELTGATGIDVKGVLFDVSFMDGSCNSLYDGCKQSTYDFSRGGILVMAAVFDQVLTGVFDTNPELVRGCSSTSACFIVVPETYLPDQYVSPAVYVAIGRNFSGDNALPPFFNALWADRDTTSDSSYTYAVVTLTSVPIPAAAWLFGSSLLGLAGIGKRRKATQVIVEV
jgi:hypothetical protein